MKLFLDHVVLIVSNIKKTKEFYSKILDDPAHEDKDSLMWQIGETKIFFSLPWRDNVTEKAFDNNRTGLNHFAFGVRTKEELEKWKEELDEVGIENTGIFVDQYNGTCIHFKDPDGIGVEMYLREE